MFSEFLITEYILSQMKCICFTNTFIDWNLKSLKIALGHWLQVAGSGYYMVLTNTLYIKKWIVHAWLSHVHL